MTVKLQTEHHLEFLSLTGGCTGLSVSTLVKMPHCWKSHAMAQIAADSEADMYHLITCMPDRCHTGVAARGCHTRCRLKCLGFVNIQHSFHDKQNKAGNPQNDENCLTLTSLLSIDFCRGNHIQQFYYVISCT